MNRLAIRTALVLALLGAFAGSGLGTGSASASDITGVTCSPVTTGAIFADVDCSKSATGPSGFVHQTLPENTSIPITILDAENAATLKTIVSGVEVMVNCASASGSGILSTAGEPEMYSFGTAKITFHECTVEGMNSCKVSGGTVTTEPLLFTTKGQGMGVKVEAENPPVLAEITITNCLGLNGTWPLKGSVVLTPHNDILASTHAETTLQGTLLWFGSHKTGLTSSLTMIGPNTRHISWTT